MCVQTHIVLKVAILDKIAHTKLPYVNLHLFSVSASLESAKRSFESVSEQRGELINNINDLKKRSRDISPELS